jgi:hypothetical protein
MSPHETDRRHLERQIVYARPIIVLLSLLALLQQPNPADAKRSISFVIAYLIVSLALIPVERFLRKRAWHLPIACDLLALGFFMYISPLSVPVWFPYLFVCWVAGSAGTPPHNSAQARLRLSSFCSPPSKAKLAGSAWSLG